MLAERLVAKGEGEIRREEIGGPTGFTRIAGGVRVGGQERLLLARLTCDGGTEGTGHLLARLGRVGLQTDCAGVGISH